MNILKTWRDGMTTGLALSAATTAAIMICSAREIGSAWAALNCVAHIVDGDDKEQPTDFSPRESALGVAVNGTAMCAWGILYSGALAVLGRGSSPLAAAIGTAVSWVIDYKIVPKQYTPGIEKRLSSKSIAVCYAALGATLALSPLWNGTSYTRAEDTHGDL